MSVEAGALDQSNQADDMSRREFLNYAWLASIGFVSLQAGYVLYRFALPRLGPGEFGGPVNIGLVDDLPAVGEDPLPFNKAKFWWVLTDEGAVALYKVCTHLGCIYDWKTDQVKFTCPCHGSQFEKEGDFITGPAPRSLDRFVIRALDSSGKEIARTNELGDPLAIPAGAQVVVETGLMIKGEPKA
jgi:cytochrome b6-f complex iron-sulfur subunit